MFCVTMWMNSFRSPPAQNALSPAPVMIATHRSGSSRKSSQALASSPKASKLSALRRSGRLMVMNAMLPFFS